MPVEERQHLFASYTLDRVRGCLLRGNDPVHLRPQAFELLSYLAAHPGRLVSKDQLIEHIWRGRAVGDDSLVQCLRDVRRAVGFEGARYIRNVRGRGYILDGELTPAVIPAAPAAPDTAPVPASDTNPANGPAASGGGATSRRLTAIPAVAIALVLAAAAYRLAGGEVSTDAPEVRSLDSGYTPGGDSQLLYLRARHHDRRTNEADLRTAIGLYRQAIAADPRHAAAYAGLANASRALAIVGRVPSSQAFPEAKDAARRALQLDPSLAEAHIALGWILFSYDWDWAGAERALETAIELDPKSPEAHRAYGHLLSNQGRHEEAILEARRARELDPTTLLTRTFEVQFLVYAGRYTEAEDSLRTTLQMEPDYWVAHLWRGRLLLARERLSDAVEAFDRAATLSKRATETITQLGYVRARLGRRDEALAVLNELEARAASHYVPAYAFALIHNGFGNQERALAYLERSVEQREVQATFIKIDRRWDWVRADPRFRALLKLLNLK